MTVRPDLHETNYVFLNWYSHNENDIISVVHPESDNDEVRTTFQFLSQNLGIVDRPSKKIYEYLALFAPDFKEREKPSYLASSEDKSDFGSCKDRYSQQIKIFFHCISQKNTRDATTCCYCRLEEQTRQKQLLHQAINGETSFFLPSTFTMAGIGTGMATFRVFVY
ncbi:hypothetical protein G6F57_003449 [Rhizopus arrhizus]|nr:hypothetical protein G6F21_002244 [Rhizopus arrhizus]KAG1428340.1 hypothetical protein G6F58_000613 [Rhizopus delemar]KAG0802274.1 hypothetical protein G6F22_000418 [Rhizopus arrhizus]KAG0814943.1 hypothetical protein G6F20_004373 [Rhizopus arrhizus]KAG0838401.1 hypothetical protein G6F19_003151 [Rhizopus arrhizus]